MLDLNAAARPHPAAGHRHRARQGLGQAAGFRSSLLLYNIFLQQVSKKVYKLPQLLPLFYRWGN